MRQAMKCSSVILAIIFSILTMGVNAGASVLTVTDPGQPSGASVAAGTAGTLAGRLSLSVDTGPVVVTALSVSNSGTALHGDDIFALSLYADSNGNGSIDPGTDDFLSNSYWSGSESIYVFSDITLEVVAGTPRTLLIAMHAAAGAEVGRYFMMSADDAGISIEDDSNTVNPFAISGSSFDLVESAVAGSVIAEAPTVRVLNPMDGAVITGTFPVQVQVYNPDGLSDLTSLDLSLDGGGSTAYSFDLINDLNPNYNVGTNAGVYETTLSLLPGGYTLVAEARNDVASAPSTAALIVVNESRRGDGHLLVRDNSDQLCADCHALQSHSSQSTGNKYGSWALRCRDCHTPHNTTNIFLMKEKIVPPNFGSHMGTVTVRFWETTGIDVSKPSYANQDNSGPCQVCHTRTEGAGGVARWRSTGNADSHFSDPDNPVRCTVCHPHSEGFRASPDETSSYCNACHLSPSGGGNDLDNYSWGDGTTAMVDLDEWLGSGHGRDASYDSGNPGADFRSEMDGGCRYCHDDQIDHNGSGIAFFRLKDQGTGPGGTWGLYNGTCLVCHASVGSTGYQPTGYSSPRNATVKVDAEVHNGGKHDDDHSGGRDCWDCHDPHGDDRGDPTPGPRLWYMIQKNPVKDRDDTTMAPSSIAPAVSFENASTYTDYTAGGLCVNCHTSTDHYPGYIKDDHPNNDYGVTERCTSCHQHDTGFENVDSCPGDPAKTDPGVCGCGTPDTDGDGDGYYVCEDCDDTDPGINSDTLWFRDSDDDGFGTYTVSTQQCDEPVGPPYYVLNDMDYDDNDDTIGAPVRIAGITPVYYRNIYDANIAASEGDTIEVLAVLFFENLYFDFSRSVSLIGGYSNDFSGVTGDTVLTGDITINSGKCTIGNFVLQ